MDTRLGDITLGQFLRADLGAAFVMICGLLIYVAVSYVITHRGRK